MEVFNAKDASTAMNLLAESALNRDEEISNFNTTRDESESDNENYLRFPYFNQFYEQGGSSAMKDLCNFEAHEFE